jgi:hypothetical protein
MEMRVLAIVTLKPEVPIEDIRAELKNEIQNSWALYSSGVVREAYATDLPARIVFVIEADNAASARRHLQSLPLVAAEMFQVDLTELRPFTNWSTLFQK